MNIIYFGSADFGVPALKNIIAGKYSVKALVTTPARHQGRGLKQAESPIALYAREHGIGPVATPENLKDGGFIEWLSGFNPDLFIVIAYKILPPEIFRIPRLGTINLHASLLPKYRGPAPIHRAIEAGERISGVSVFKIDKGIDSGKIIIQKSTPINDKETTPQLYERLSVLGAEAILEVCRLFEEDKVCYTAQDASLITKAPKLDKKEANIDWSLPAEVIFNKIRAFKPFPGTCTVFESKLLKIEWAEPVPQSDNGASGTITSVGAEWFDVQCRQSTLRVFEVKLEGKKQMKVRDFLLGTPVKKGMKLG
jgi:methionyl-tRNA formyltransferase